MREANYSDRNSSLSVTLFRHSLGMPIPWRQLAPRFEIGLDGLKPRCLPRRGCAQIKHGALHERRCSAQLQFGLGRTLVVVSVEENGDLELDVRGFGEEFVSIFVPADCVAPKG